MPRKGKKQKVVQGRIKVGAGIGHENEIGGENGDVNGYGGRTGAGTRTNVEANKVTPDESGDGGGNGAGTGTETRVESCRGTQDEKADRSGDRNESNSGDLNWDKDGNGDGNEDGIREDGGEANERKKSHKLSLRTRHHLCRQEVALAGTRQLHLQGPVSVQVDRTQGVTG